VRLLAQKLSHEGIELYSNPKIRTNPMKITKAAILFEALLGGPAAAPFLAFKRERIESGNYEEADFPLRWLQKDLHLAAVSAYETGAAMPLTNLAKEIYRLAIREGRGSEDFSAIYGYLARSQDAQPGVDEYLSESGEVSSRRS
jgi:hypothetical protein